MLHTVQFRPNFFASCIISPMANCAFRCWNHWETFSDRKLEILITVSNKTAASVFCVLLPARGCTRFTELSPLVFYIFLLSIQLTCTGPISCTWSATVEAVNIHCLADMPSIPRNMFLNMDLLFWITSASPIVEIVLYITLGSPIVGGKRSFNNTFIICVFFTSNFS